MIDQQTVWDDIWPVVEQLISATLAEDPRTIESHLLPGSQAADALELFGFPVFDILLKIILGRERLGLTRAIVTHDERVFIEYAWPDSTNPDEDYTAVDVVTIQLTRSGEAWLVEQINPAAVDLPLNGMRAGMILAGSSDLLQQANIPNEPWVLPLTLYAGVLQLPMRTAAMADAVEEALLPGLQARQFGFLSQINARRLWRDFLAASQRDFRAAAAPELDKPAAWAAGVEYILSEMLMKKQSQATVAKPYGVSLGLLSSRAKAIKSTLEIGELETRYNELYLESIIL